MRSFVFLFFLFGCPALIYAQAGGDWLSATKPAPSPQGELLHNKPDVEDLIQKFYKSLKCHVCDGTGIVHQKVEVGWDNGEIIYGDQPASCPNCAGTGIESDLSRVLSSLTVALHAIDQSDDPKRDTKRKVCTKVFEAYVDSCIDVMRKLHRQQESSPAGPRFGANPAMNGVLPDAIASRVDKDADAGASQMVSPDLKELLNESSQWTRQSFRLLSPSSNPNMPLVLLAKVDTSQDAGQGGVPIILGMGGDASSGLLTAQDSSTPLPGDYFILFAHQLRLDKTTDHEPVHVLQSDYVIDLCDTAIEARERTKGMMAPHTSDKDASTFVVQVSPEKVTAAAQKAAEEFGLGDITATNTQLDGLVTARTAHGELVRISIDEAGDGASSVTVRVGNDDGGESTSAISGKLVDKIKELLQ